MAKQTRRQLPVVSLGAEYLTIGYLLRRNILAYKAPPNNEGYDIICIHPNPKRATKQIRVQVKSRYQTDCNRIILLKEKSLDAFDYLILVFLNIGCFYKKKPTKEVLTDPEFYTLPIDFVREHHLRDKGWDKIKTKNLELNPFKNEKGFELIAKDLGIDHPGN
jgi:hypothetical protein